MGAGILPLSQTTSAPPHSALPVPLHVRGRMLLQHPHRGSRQPPAELQVSWLMG